MAELAKRTATYQDLYHIPENMTGEIIDGELITSPRPSARHMHATSVLGYELGPPISNWPEWTRGMGDPG